MNSCLLTSACFDYQNKVLGKLLEKNSDEFSCVEPKIVECINNSDKKDKYYTYISEVADKCVKLIDKNERDRALQEYKFMVTNLKEEFKL